MASSKKSVAIVVVILVAIAVFALLATNKQQNGINSPARVSVPSGTNETALVQNGTTLSPTQCHSVNQYLPDPSCTPGAIDPKVTQANIHQTICVPGYSASVRPPSSITNPMKRESMKSYGHTDSPSNYEYDHLVPLELGGAPQDPRNLWPEPGYGADDFRIKDKLENYLHNQVCNGIVALSEAQQEIAQNWLAAYQKAGLQ